MITCVYIMIGLTVTYMALLAAEYIEEVWELHDKGM